MAVVRLLIGGAFLWFGISKLMNPTLLYGGLMFELSNYGAPYAFYERFVLARVEIRQELFVYLVAAGEIMVGASFLTGALVSWAALGGAFMMLNFGMAISSGHPLTMVLHALFAAVFLAMGRMGAGLTWGLDGWLVNRVQDWVVLFPLRLSRPKQLSAEQRGE